jgi:hypothetical protein
MVRGDAAGVKPGSTIFDIDDWACKQGQRDRPLICGLERRCIDDLPPDRVTATVGAWVRHRPSARQVTDRWHLMENASQALLDAVSKSMHVTAKPLAEAISTQHV